jgi:hypothetical protein
MDELPKSPSISTGPRHVRARKSASNLRFEEFDVQQSKALGLVRRLVHIKWLDRQNPGPRIIERDPHTESHYA